MRNIVLAALFLLTSPLALRAHPVTYEDGLALMSWNTSMMTDQWIGYSFSPRYSLTARYLALRDGQEQQEYYLTQANWLVKRWNAVGSQANVYLSGAAGVRRDDDTAVGTALGAAEADWESRRYYTSAKYQLMAQGLEYYRVRVGMAPYLGEFKDLHTWVMLQVENQPEFLGPVQVTPLLRFFKDNVLWEVGASLRGQMMFNFMVHY